MSLDTVSTKNQKSDIRYKAKMTLMEKCSLCEALMCNKPSCII